MEFPRRKCRDVSSPEGRSSRRLELGVDDVSVPPGARGSRSSGAGSGVFGCATQTSTRWRGWNREVALLRIGA
jgi:hypothetical protein